MKIKSAIRLLVLLVCILFQVQNAWAIATEPTVQTISFTANFGSCSEIDLNFTKGDGSRRIIIASPDVPVSHLPVDGTGYNAGSIYGTGTDLGNNNFVVYSASSSTSSTTITITGLSGGTQYYFAIFEYNGTGNNANYLTTGYLTADAVALGFTMSVSSSSGDMCVGDSVRLEVHGANSYSWTPSSSLSSSKDSIVWAKPTNTIVYTVAGSDTSGCADTKTLSVTVYQLPNVTLGSFSNKCINGAQVTLSSGSPSGGTYSGTGVSGNHFTPSVAGLGQFVITYTYSDIHNCSNHDTSKIRVVDAPTVAFATLSDVCLDAPTFALTAGSPTGGTYSGTGVSSGQFNPPAAGVGQFQLRYIYTDGSTGCSDTAFRSQRVRALPTVAFATLQPVCLNVQPFLLTGGTPTGGSYSGTGVSNSQFSPLVSGAGTFTLNYAYTDSFGCSKADTSKITVFTIPSVSFAPLTEVCQNTGPVTLTGGTPTGGTYSGTAVGGSIFYTGIAGPGQHTITYTYSNANNCINTATQDITVNVAPNPNLGPDIHVCSDEAAHLTGGNFSTYAWSTGAHTSSINVDTTGRGLGTFPFVLIVTNNFGCANKDTILVTFDPCSGINNFLLEGNSFDAFPNPFTSNITVKAEAGSDIVLYDLNGKVIIQENNVPAIYSFDVHLPSGSYILKVKKDENVAYRLLLKN
jgi:hypothetical protein